MEEKDSSVDKPEEEEFGRPVLREFTPEELKKILEEQEKWIFTEGKEGRKANLEKANLANAELQKANLVEANLRGAFLGGANLQAALLGLANLQKADLLNSNLQGADLAGSDLREASLVNTNLTSVTSLRGEQLAGANVTNAKLPRGIAKFEEGLKVVEEASRNARKLFFAMLSACAYALLTIATTTDVLLLTNSRSSPLPIIRTEIPIVWFYIAAPLVLLCLYFYFHLYMQRLWEGLALLPAVFPDGRPLDQKAYPWLLIGLVRAHVFHLKKNRPPLSHLQEWISVALAWWFMPATLICFWLRYLPRQDWLGTALHIGLLVVAVWAGVLFYRLAVGTLRWDENEFSLWKKPFGEIGEVTTYKRGVVAITLGGIIFLLSLGTINGVQNDKFQFNDARTWVTYVCEQFGLSPFANFREKDVSVKPANWSGKEEEIPQVKGAPLRRRNLRYAQAYRAFLVNGDLRQADMAGANLWEANLQEASLQGANLEKANLGYANLQEAKLTGASLQGTNLGEANLQGAILTEARLQGAKLERANLQGAYIGLTIGLTKDQLHSATNWILASYGKRTLETLGLPPDHYSRLSAKNLSGYNLQGTNLRRANLQETNLGRANLQKADLSYANLQKADLSYTNLQGVAFEEADLRNANLQGANLQEADFPGTKLQGSNLEYTRLEGAKFEGAKLQDARLYAASLQGAHLGEATNLEKADLTSANLRNARFDEVNLQEANFENASLEGAEFDEVNLRKAKNLTIGQLSKVKTLIRSQLDPELMEQIKRRYPDLFE